jgi:hypothetical protein
MTTTKKKQTKKPLRATQKKAPQRATRYWAEVPDNMGWLDDAIAQAERNLNHALRREEVEKKLAESLKQEQASGANLANYGSLPGERADRRVMFQGGTYRESRRPMYHLVPIELLQAVAQTRQHGDLKYEPGNWKKGDRAFFVDCVNHTIEHLWDTVDPDSLTDPMVSLGHAATNIAFMLWALRRGVIERRDFERAAVLERRNG